MSQSSIPGGERAARQAAGKDVDSLGPSDSSDSGSDVQGETEIGTGADNPGEFGALPTGGDNDSDASGTGERASATGRDVPDGSDIAPDRIVADADGDLDVDDGASADTRALGIDDVLSDEADDGDDADALEDTEDTEDDNGAARQSMEAVGGTDSAANGRDRERS